MRTLLRASLPHGDELWGCRKLHRPFQPEIRSYRDSSNLNTECIASPQKPHFREHSVWRDSQMSSRDATQVPEHGRSLEVLLKPEVAAGRLAEGDRSNGLMQEPLLADMLGPSSGMMELVQPIKEYAARLVAEAEETTGEAHMAFNSVVNIRTTDERLLGALKRHHAERRNGEGTQVVLLGAGLDTRAWRLPLPPGTKVFEVDEPALVSFKLQRLAASGAQTKAGPSQRASRRAVHPVKHPLKAGSWHAVPADLARPDWHEALTGAGFDKGQHTVFIAEGLLYYLQPETAAGLLRSLAALAAPGSVLLMTCMNKAYLKGSYETMKRGGSMNKRYSAFFQFGLPDDVSGFLAPLGWEVAERDLVTMEDAHKALGVGVAAPAQVKEEQRLNEAQFGPLHMYLVRATVVK